MISKISKIAEEQTDEHATAILGAGSWGTAVAVHLGLLKRRVYLWGRNSEYLRNMQNARQNLQYLPGVIFPESLQIESSLEKIIARTENIIIAVPSVAFRETLVAIQPYLVSGRHAVVWLTKGLDPAHHEFLSAVAKDILGDKKIPLGVLSGPTFAKEIAHGLPAAVTLASEDKHFAEKIIALLHGENLRVYYSQDMIGVQLGGAVKNVLAIATGIAEGLKCGANAEAALITRGLAEMLRLGDAVGGKRETLMGLAGVGDLILTCTNHQSRNRRFGEAIGAGKTQEEALQVIGQVVEGLATAAEVYHLAQQYRIEMPVTMEVYRVLYEHLPPREALKNLLARTPKAES